MQSELKSDIKTQQAPQTQVNMLILNNLFSKEIEEDAYNSDEDPVQVVNFDNELKYLKELKGVDIVFLLDTTASMAGYLPGIKRFIRKLINDARNTLTQYIADEELLSVGIVQYRDHPPQETTFITNVINLTQEFVQFKEALKKINAKGGGDGPEAVVDGLHDALNSINWRKGSEKFIYHILDAPPHGAEFSSLKDGFQDGCPCGHDWEELLLKMREMEIDYTVIKLSNDLNTMIEKFAEKLKLDVMEPAISFDESKKVSQTN
jgi:hypothetical protein